MSTGAEYSSHRPRSEDARIDETFVRILFVEERSDVADEVRRSLGETGRGSFEVVRETSLVRAAAQIRGDSFDLLLVDPQLPDIERSAVLELANDLAHRLPVVLLTGTEELEGAPRDLRDLIRERLVQADLPRKLLSAIRRARRLGTGVMTPEFCRLERLCG
ncbi:MAG: response regulator [Spirochaetaceae bacterium]|nr:response regulator [Myxococcales bacterium]MCA9607157.1 response regulator [Myxococcales bacterium]MCB9722521.1 response regulator [Spirochaetaceae bacterium]HPG24172.1 response regulator [Myxococcota bacterium]